MKAFKIELLVLDFDQLGGDEIKSVLENSSYPNDCISPSAMKVTGADIGPWSDDNPLNSGKTREAEYARIFPAEASPVAADGWQLVPTVPTDEMIVAFAEEWYSRQQCIDDPDMADAYKSMLAVAPIPS